MKPAVLRDEATTTKQYRVTGMSLGEYCCHLYRHLTALSVKYLRV